MRLRFAVPVVLMLAACFFGCGSDNNSEPPPPEPPGPDASYCTVGETTGCEADAGAETGPLVCEDVPGGHPGCFAPLTVQGKVIDAVSGTAIAGALVVARDANQTAISNVAISAADGTYQLTVPAPRDSTGTPLSENITLRADAAGFLTFPEPPRVALPFDVATATGDPPVVQNPATEIGLLPIPGASVFGSISGTVIAPKPGGTLVVAGGRTGVADAAGAYSVFNIAAGDVNVGAYSAKLQFQPTTATVAAGQNTASVDLQSIDTATMPLVTVTGKVQIVNAPGGSTTSVVLVVEDTFLQQEWIARGETPKGLRAANVSGDFSIPDVPAGRYVVLAAFENDGLVRDPDTSIAGTQVVHVLIESGGINDVGSFKITGALDVISPGAWGIDEVSGTPTFQWKDDSSETGYQLFVYDAFGIKVWDKLDVPSEHGNDVSVVYAGPALTKNMYYQFRAVSMKNTTAISMTEDLKGVFIYK